MFRSGGLEDPQPLSSEWGDAGLTLPSEYKLDDVGPWIREIRKHKRGNQWFAGDLYGDMEDRFGERASQYIEDFAYTPESLANAIRVCKRFPFHIRRDALTFGHHALLVKCEPLEAGVWLDNAVEYGWSVAELRRQVHPPTPSVKRWTLAQLRESLAAFESRPLRNNGRKFAAAFIESLETLT